MYSDLVTAAITFFSVLIVGIVLATMPFYLLWNWIMPLFGLPNLTLVQCWGLLLLIQILSVPYNYSKG